MQQITNISRRVQRKAQNTQTRNLYSRSTWGGLHSFHHHSQHYSRVRSGPRTLLPIANSARPTGFQKSSNGLQIPKPTNPSQASVRSFRSQKIILTSPVQHSHQKSQSTHFLTSKNAPLISFVQRRSSHDYVLRGLPHDIYVLRHGESEGNATKRVLESGFGDAYRELRAAKHTSKYRLTDLGRAQAKAAGTWLMKNVGSTFDFYYASEYLRAQETAAHLQLPNARWQKELYARELNKGAMSGYTKEERKSLFYLQEKAMQQEPYFAAAPSGESWADLCWRADQTVDRWKQSYQSLLNDGKHLDGSELTHRLLLVCHGNFMLALRMRMENLTRQDWDLVNKKPKDARDQIPNGGILHYSRVNPVTGEIAPVPRWKRFIDTWHTPNAPSQWEELAPKYYTNEELIAFVEKTAPVDVSFWFSEKFQTSLEQPIVAEMDTTEE